MCGIAGILSAKGMAGCESSLLSMQASLRHRGPDDQGIYVSPKKLAGLVHTRLSILDLSSAGHQPMQSPDGRYVIVFNGEIYNFRELRAELSAEGVVFNSHTDTEVILKLYERLGVNCLPRLRGMFAFAVWDEQEESCFFARDPLGIKPLYYGLKSGRLIFASEVRTILKQGDISTELDRAGVFGYLVTGSVPEPKTIFKNIHSLTAGHYLLYENGRLDDRCYWNPDFKTLNVSSEEAFSRTRAALVDSVSYHLVSDVPVGIFLSGGLDSSAILALARANEAGAELHTYSIALEDAARNEGGIAKKTAAFFGAKHTELMLTASIAKELFSKFLTSIDKPTIDGFNTYCVCYLASQCGIKVVLSGLGGDELFGGYPSFRAVPNLFHFAKAWSLTGPLGRGAANLLGRVHCGAQWRRVAELLSKPPSFLRAYQCFRGNFAKPEAASILRHSFPDLGLPSEDEVDCVLHNGVDIDHDLGAVSWLEISNYMRNQLLGDSDVFSMAWSLELRTPFVDSRLCNELHLIPAGIRCQVGKRLLQEAVPELPKFLLNLPKRGFQFPFDQWLSSEWSDVFGRISAPDDVCLDTWYRKWSLFVLKDYLAARSASF